jgi:hypothetical protein
MASFSLDTILHRARALCVKAGLDPDRLAPDGRPEWLRFVGEARASLWRDLEAQDPLELLKAVYEGEHAGEADVAPPGNAAGSVDPLEKLQELYEKEMGRERARAAPLAHDASPYELNAPSGLARELDGAAPTLAFRREPSDPLEELKALEAAGAVEAVRDETALDLASTMDDLIVPPAEQEGGRGPASNVDAVIEGACSSVSHATQFGDAPE